MSNPNGGDLGQKIVDNYTQSINDILLYKTIFDVVSNNIKSNGREDGLNFIFETNKKQIAFYTALKLNYKMIIDNRINDIPLVRKALQQKANELIRTIELTNKAQFCDESFYIDTCDVAKKKINELDGCIALVC